MRAVLRDPQLVEQLVEVPTIISYSSLQRTMEQNVDIPVPGGGGVFKVFFLNRVQQLCFLLQNAFLSGLWSRSLIFPLEAFKIFAQDRVHPLFRMFQLVVMKLRMGLVKEVFRTFPRNKKSAKLGQYRVRECRQCQPIHARCSALSSSLHLGHDPH